MNKLSVVINTLNEEKNLAQAISSIKKIAHEIIVVDMESDDDTKTLAGRLGARVFDHKRTNYVEPARNFAISKATGDWILILDADEELSKPIRLKIKSILEKPTADYYRIPRKNFIFGKWIRHSRWWPDYNIRLFKKGSVSWGEVIHSVPLTVGKGSDLEAKALYAIKHNHYETIEQFITRLNRYTTEHSKLLLENGYEFHWNDLILKPSNEFLSRYFFGEGYKDGLHGLAISGLQAFSEFTLYLKVWQSKKFIEKDLVLDDVIATMKKSEKDFHYWQADGLVKLRGGIVNILKRKFKLS